MEFDKNLILFLVIAYFFILSYRVSGGMLPIYEILLWIAFGIFIIFIGSWLQKKT